LEPADFDGPEHISNESWKTCLKQLVSGFEPEFGGFSQSPKFPQPSNMNFLFHVFSRNPESEEGKTALNMCLHTLKMMAKGGMHDHVSQVNFIFYFRVVFLIKFIFRGLQDIQLTKNGTFPILKKCSMTKVNFWCPTLKLMWQQKTRPSKRLSMIFLLTLAEILATK